MSTIVCRSVCFGYDGAASDVFTDLNLIIDTGWRTALVGRNGRGKTTLLRLIAGRLEPQKGSVERAVATCEFPADPLDDSASTFEVAKDAAGPFRSWEREMETLLASGDEASLQRYGELEIAYQEQGGYEIDAALSAELALLELESAVHRQAFASLSGGEQTRCLLAGLFTRRDGYPLIDEPTNHLDLAGRAQLADYLSTKAGFLLVSHDRTFLDASTDHVIALNQDTVEVHRIGFSEWHSAHLGRLEEQARRNRELKKDISRLETAARERRRGADQREADKGPHMDKGFVGARAARQMKRALAAERRARHAADDRRAALLDVEKSYSLKLAAPESAGPGSLIVANNLVVCRDEALFAPVSFELHSGTRLAVLGPNGSGKTSLLDLIAGVPHVSTGVLNRPGHVSISRVHQLPLWTAGDLRRRLADAQLDESRFRQIMAALGVRGELLERPLQTLSLGQQKKIELARCLMTPAHVLLMDEPLNYIDIDAREQIEALLMEQSPTVMFVEHDAAFVDRVATDILRLLPA